VKFLLKNKKLVLTTTGNCANDGFR